MQNQFRFEQEKLKKMFWHVEKGETERARWKKMKMFLLIASNWTGQRASREFYCRKQKTKSSLKLTILCNGFYCYFMQSKHETNERQKQTDSTAQRKWTRKQKMANWRRQGRKWNRKALTNFSNDRMNEFSHYSNIQHDIDDADKNCWICPVTFVLPSLERRISRSNFLLFTYFANDEYTQKQTIFRSIVFVFILSICFSHLLVRRNNIWISVLFRCFLIHAIVRRSLRSSAVIVFRSLALLCYILAMFASFVFVLWKVTKVHDIEDIFIGPFQM